MCPRVRRFPYMEQFYVTVYKIIIYSKYIIMPFKKSFKRKFVKKSFRKKRFVRKSRSARGEVMTNRSDPRKHTVVADRYRTQMFQELMFELNSAALPATNYFDVYGNFLNEPYAVLSPGQVVSTLTGYALLGGSTTALLLCPNGFSDLSNLYQSYIVRASRITVNITPSNQTTALSYAVRMCVFPWCEWNSLGVTPPTTIEGAQVMPYARMITVTTMNNVKQNTIVNYVSHHKLLGVTKQQYDDNPFSQISSTYTAVEGPAQYTNISWRVIYQVFATGTTTYTLACSCNVKYYVEWLQPSLNFGITA